MLRFIRPVACLALIAMAMSALATEAPARSIQQAIPSQPLREALQDWALQTGTQLMYDADLASGLTTRGAPAGLPAIEALGKILEGTGLVYRVVNDRMISILSRKQAALSDERGHTHGRRSEMPARLEVAQAQNAEEKRFTDAQGADRLDSQSSQDKLQEIVVTAQKREERLQDVPISMAVIGSQEIERRGLIGMEDYLRSIPGVNQIDRGIMDNAIVVRGITTSPEAENFSSGATVATYFGETPITGLGGYVAGGIDVRPVDLERIEMLRGPQGTTFGSGSLSGALRLIPKAPELDRFGADVSAEYSRTGRDGGGNSMVQAVANLPIARDRFGVRIVGYRYDESGIYRNIAGLDPASLAFANQWGVGNLVSGFVDDDVGSQVSTGGRVAALWRVNDSFRIALNALTQKIEQKGRPFASLDLYEQASFPVAPIRRVDGDPGEYFESNVDLYNIVMDYDLSWATLTSTASWVDGGVSPALATGATIFPFTGATYMDVESLTAETRLASRLEGRFQFTAGLFYEDTKNANWQSVDWLGAGVAPNPLTALGFLYATDPTQVIETNRKVAQRAIFGEVSYALTDAVTATVGGRYFDYEKSEYRLAEGGLIGIPLGAGVPTNIRTNETDHTLKANISYKPVQDALLYASWSQGFRLGRPQPAVPAAACDRNNDGLIDGRTVTIESTRSVNSDFLDSSEIGAKIALFDRRMTVDVAAYHLKWDGVPVLVALPNVDTCRGTYTANVGAARSDGAEIQASFVATAGLTLTLGGGYMEAELSKDAPAVRGAVKGARLPGAPRVSANLGAQYEFQIAAHKAFVRADSFYTGDFYGDLLETPGLRSGDYIKVDARAGIAFGPLSAELFVKNLTNADDFTWRGLTGGTNPFFGYRLRPRTVGLQLGYSFN